MPAIATKPKSVDEIKAELDAVKAKKEAEQAAPEKKKDWHGFIYCDAYGWCWIADIEKSGEVKNICLGRTEEFIPYLRRRGIDGTNVINVLIASQEFLTEKKNQVSPGKGDFGTPREKKSHSGHSNTKNGKSYISIPPEKSIVATFKNNPQLLRLLEGLITQDIGVRTIHSQLRDKGYNIPQRTVTRWVSQMRTRELL